MTIQSRINRELLKKINQQKQLTIKVGFDPTAPDLHLGHAVLLTAMRYLQSFKHKIVFLIGDFTALIGDPSGRSLKRPILSKIQINENAKTYKRQILKILDPAYTEIRFNSEWFDRMKLENFIKIVSHFSISRILERDDFQNRLKKKHPVFIHEICYPIIQAYDSVFLKADIELGGEDQLFNLLVGRNLMRNYELTPQSIITMPLLPGLDGLQKMSKSLNNYIAIEESPYSQFSKLMSISDNLLWQYFELLSYKPGSEIQILKSIHPKDAKISFALEIVARFHGEELAISALNQFNALFGKQNRTKVPKNALKFQINFGLNLLSIISNCSLLTSNSEGKRLLKQAAVLLNGTKISNGSLIIQPGNYFLRIGKMRWARVQVKKLFNNIGHNK